MKRKIIKFIAAAMMMAAPMEAAAPTMEAKTPTMETTLSTETEPADNNLYALTGLITSVNYDTDLVTVEDYNGNLWTFYGCEDWMEGDCCSMVMDSKGTDIIFDDVIVSTRYCAWTLNRNTIQN